MKDFSYITHSHPSYIESLYKDFVKDPESVEPEFRRFFEGFDFAVSSGNVTNGHTVAELPQPGAAKAAPAAQLDKEFAVYNLILAYRNKGHLVANTNPIRKRKDRGANLDLKYFNLTDADLSQSFAAGKFIGLENATLQQILTKLQTIYTGHVGIEYDYILKHDRLEWLQNEVEKNFGEQIPISGKK
ncbi:MAG TPA: 2-oxoglutarate dehydrogenase E1 component, partial [Flavisolibacter sp.]|nr:2-oxoglutarate dehydrogenase E1 component [Flavisolibacter sp.]